MALSHPDLRCASLDHIIPVSENGTHEDTNIRLSHFRCNIKRKATAMNDQLRLI